MPGAPKSQINHFSAASNKVFRRAIILRKMIKRVAKGKEASNPFLKTIKIFCSKTETTDAKMILDTGCEAHNLISYQVIDDMHKTENIIKKESILKFMGFGGRTMLPKKTKDEKAEAAERRREHDQEVATNEADIAANEMAKQSASSWSNWEWDESQQSYYRARLIGDAWQYQYSTNLI
ncbi:uncharacterized protein LY89DRAFT_730035 [Mollisia scopiformis]|uniref:Uncharacterized protein n=1 Tax=Mollisia scopiformis TaxID=149040 RepID=A0A194XNC6_MOLSC|nr:uncharacterized protein LY89DRAFT_730035 [Mollisia scopiformis]KUJ21247.1 hypothetical protein LY89DRAFT_730035 [Mollisia scopiformis]